MTGRQQEENTTSCLKALTINTDDIKMKLLYNEQSNQPGSVLTQKEKSSSKTTGRLNKRLFKVLSINMYDIKMKIL